MNVKIQRVDGLETSFKELLKQKGFLLCHEVLFTSEFDLMKMLDLDLYAVRWIVLQIATFISKGKKKSIYDIQLENKSKVTHISTGILPLDKALCGGIKCGLITEIVGRNNAGKTQFCLSMIVQTMLQFSHNCSVLVYNYKTIFNAARLSQIACSRHPDTYNKENPTSLNILNNRVRIKNFKNAYELLDELGSSNLQEYIIDAKVKLLVIDSIASIKSEFDTNNIPKRQELLGKICSKLKDLSFTLGVAILVTNEMNVSKEASLGWIWGHAINTRLTLQIPSLFAIRTAVSEEGQSKRQIIITKCSFAPQECFPCKICDAGIIYEECESHSDKHQQKEMIAQMLTQMSQMDGDDMEEGPIVAPMAVENNSDVHEEKELKNNQEYPLDDLDDIDLDEMERQALQQSEENKRKKQKYK